MTEIIPANQWPRPSQDPDRFLALAYDHDLLQEALASDEERAEIRRIRTITRDLAEPDALFTDNLNVYVIGDPSHEFAGVHFFQKTWNRSQTHSVVLTVNLSRSVRLNDAHLRALLAHELGHFHYGIEHPGQATDQAAASKPYAPWGCGAYEAASASFLMASTIGMSITAWGFGYQEGDEGLVPVLAATVGILMIACLALCISAAHFYRGRAFRSDHAKEFYCDHYAARLTSAQDVAGMLRVVCQPHGPGLREVYRAWRKHGLNCRTHPSVGRRVRRVRGVGA